MAGTRSHPVRLDRRTLTGSQGLAQAYERTGQWSKHGETLKELMNLSKKA
jgi:hypothetical protein